MCVYLRRETLFATTKGMSQILLSFAITSALVERAICFVNNFRRRKCGLRLSHVRKLFATFRE